MQVSFHSLLTLCFPTLQPNRTHDELCDEHIQQSLAIKEKKISNKEKSVCLLGCVGCNRDKPMKCPLHLILNLCNRKLSEN